MPTILRFTTEALQLIARKPWCLYLISELKQIFKLFYPAHFLLAVTEFTDTCELLLSSHHHPGISSTCYLHLCSDHYLIWQSLCLLTTGLKLIIFLSVLGMTIGASIRLGPWWEMCRVHFASQMLVRILCLWMGKMHEFAYFKVTWILFQTNPIRFYLFNFFLFC